MPDINMYDCDWDTIITVHFEEVIKDVDDIALTAQLSDAFQIDVVEVGYLMDYDSGEVNGLYLRSKSKTCPKEENLFRLFHEIVSIAPIQDLNGKIIFMDPLTDEYGTCAAMFVKDRPDAIHEWAFNEDAIEHLQNMVPDVSRPQVSEAILGLYRDHMSQPGVTVNETFYTLMSDKEIADAASTSTTETDDNDAD
jgi:hypothetical protein